VIVISGEALLYEWIMDKNDKSKEQLLHELDRLKKQVFRLQKAESDHSKSNKRLQEYVEKYKNLVEKACDGIAIIQDMEFQYVNPELARMVGCHEIDLLGKPFTEFIHPDELTKVVDRHKRRLAGEEVPSIYESAIIAKDGRKILVEFNASQNFYLGKATTFVFVRNISERKKDEEIQAAVYRISEAAYSAADLQEFYQTIHEIIAELMPAKDNFYISLYDENAKMLHFPYFVDEEEENPGPQKMEKGLTEYVFRTGRSLLASPKVFAALEKKGEVISIGPPSIDWLGVPLKIDGKTIGVLTVQSYTEGVRYTEEEKNVLTFIAEQVAMAIERKEAAQALKKSEKQIRTLIEAIPASIYFKNTEGKNLVVNKAYEALVGRKREEIIGKTDDELLSENLAKQCRKSDRKVFATGKVYHSEEKHLSRDGEMSHYDTIKAPILDEFGEIMGLVGISHDITERKKTEAALEASQEQYRDLVEKAGIAILIDDVYGNFQYVNERYARLFGYSEKEMRKKSIRDVVFAGDLEMVMQYHKNRVHGKKAPSRYEFRGIKKDGTLIYLEINARAIKRGKKIVGTRCYIWDITARKQTEKRLKASLVEKDLLLREIHHRVKNNLQIISSLLNLQSRHIEDEFALDMFQESRNRVRSMALVHEKLYRSDDLAKVDFCEYIQSLGRHLFMSYSINSTVVDLEVNVNDVFLDINTSIPCGLIVNELISNSLKHAFSGRKQGKIRVVLKSENNGKYLLAVSDNGVGLPKGLDVTQTESLGLQLVTMLVEQLQGTLHIKNDKGTSFEIVFGKLNYRARH
jgi:PAS domain S-box-containing protein